MAINKVEFGDEVLIDLTEDTVTEDTLLEGETAHDASGNQIRGIAKIDTTEVSTTDLLNSAEGNIRSLHLLGRGRKSKNLINPTYETKTADGVTCTNNGDGTYTMNGTASAITNIRIAEKRPLSELQLILSTVRWGGLPSGLGYSSIWFNVLEDSTFLKSYHAQGVYETKTLASMLSEYPNANMYELGIYIAKDITLENVVVKPMLVDADLYSDVTYDDFEPYVKSNVELANELRNLIKSDTVSGTTDSTSNIPTVEAFKKRLVISAILVGGDVEKHNGIVTVGGYNGYPWYFHITGPGGNSVGSGKNVTVKYWYIDMP